MKIFFTTALGISLAVHSFSQDQHLVDSLTHLVYTTQDDSIKGLVIARLVQEYVYTKPDSCIFYSDLGLDLISNGSIKERFDHSPSVELFSFEARMYSIRSVALSEQRNDLFAVQMAMKAKEVAEKSERKDLVGYISGNMAEVYQNVGDPGTAIEYLRITLDNDTSWRGQQIWTGNLGSCFYDLKEYDSALFYLNKIEPGFLLEENRPWPYPPLYLGHTWVKKGEFKKAIPYYRISIGYAVYDHFGYDLCRAYLGIADAFKGLGMTDSAILYANRSIQLANQLSLPEQSLNANTFLGSLYESKGIIDSAYKYQKISIALKDTIFNAEKIKGVQNYTFTEKLRQREMIQEQLAYKNKLRFFGLAGGFVVLLFLIGMLIRNNMHKQKAYALLQNQKQQTDAQKAKAEKTLEELRSTQSQLIQSEKMASLGELTAGIAHEIQNPLNFVNNFSEVNSELIGEMKKEIDSANLSAIKAITADLERNSEKITNHGKRADAIVKSMLLHSRETMGQKELTDVNALAEEYLRLCFQGLRVRDKTFTANLRIRLDPAIDKINIIPQDMVRVLLNLYNNAFYAVTAKKVKMGEGYDPTVTLTTRKDEDKVELKVSDNGNGIPPKVLDKIFQPFFTTKPTGQGTGLGLSLSYDIIKAHGGEIFVATKEGEGTEFTIQLHI